MTDQEKVELEQVPLKSDVDPPAGSETDKSSQPTEEQPKKKCSKWFFKKSKNGEITTTEITMTTTDEKKKVCKWWPRKQPKEATNGEQQMTVGINMLDRDEKGLNNHVVMDFGDVFAEPDSNHSWQWTWRTAHHIYSFISGFVYKLLAAIFAIPIAVLFGILFALFSAISIFLCTPIGRLLGIPANGIAKAWDFFVHRFLDPIFSSLGLCCGAFASRKTDMHDSPTVLA
uniref:Caveolin n=1 Tax=Parascaris univalens TaxID=6257 RepID=A0A915BI11_PARUN